MPLNTAYSGIAHRAKRLFGADLRERPPSELLRRHALAAAR